MSVTDHERQSRPLDVIRTRTSSLRVHKHSELCSNKNTHHKLLKLAKVGSVVFTVEAEQQLEWLLFFRHQHNFEREAVVLLRAVDGERQTRVGFVEEFWKNKTEEITASSTCTCTCTIMQNRRQPTVNGACLEVGSVELVGAEDDTIRCDTQTRCGLEDLNVLQERSTLKAQTTRFAFEVSASEDMPSGCRSGLSCGRT